MAEVFLANAAGPLGFEKKVVVKRILPHLADDPHFIELFLAEARILAQLDHPNVVQVFDFGSEDGSFFLAMEYIDGLDVRTLMERAKARNEWLPLGLCARIVSLAAEGLAYAHDFHHPQTGDPVNLVHRDATPENVIVSRTGAVKVVDFGIAKVVDGPQTKAVGLKGKLPYMAPEQIRGEPVDRRTDVYALGVMLYQLITGERPFVADSEAALMQHIVYRPYIPMEKHRADVPARLQAIVQRCLVKEMDERYATCHELRDALERFILDHGEPASSHHLAFLAQRYAEAPAEEGSGSLPPPPRRPTRDNQRATRLERSRPQSEAVVAVSLGDDVPEGTGSSAKQRWIETRVAPPSLRPPPPRKGPLVPVSPPPEPRTFTESRPPSRAGLWALLVLLFGAAGAVGWFQFVSPRSGSTAAVPFVLPAPAAPKPLEARTEVTPAGPSTGTLVVAVDPPMEVFVNGVLLGRAPVTLKDHPVGELTVQVSDDVLGLKREEKRVLVPGNNGTYRVSFGKAKLEFRVRPYGEIFLDGNSLGITPLPAVTVFEGEHKIEVRNAELGKTVTQTYSVKAEEALLIKVDLTEH